MGFLPAKEQLKRLESGVEELLPREEFEERLDRSVKTGQPLRVKQGFDPTAPDIHLGHTVGLRKLRQFQELGHQVVLIVGNYTTLVGDPSGRSATRPQLTSEQVEENARTYLEQFFRVVDAGRTQVLRNGDWFARMGMKDVIRLCARYTVARTLERDDFAKRIAAGHPISVHELLYPLMQGYDSVMIRCDLELGATEQKFNLLVGRSLQEDYLRGEMPWADEFIPDSVKSVPVPKQGQVVLTLPILVGTDGKQRMSKSLGNYIGVAEPANIMFEKLMRLPDECVADYARLLLDAGSAEQLDVFSRVENARQKRGGGNSDGARLEARAAIERLAHAIVACYHGAAAAEQSAAQYRSGSALPANLKVLELSATEEPATWVGYIAVKAGLAKSTSEARNFLRDGAFSTLLEGGDWERVSDPDQKIPSRAGAPAVLLRKGKRQETTVQIVWK